ncbi:winged helix-turn-helix domain-containing protein, partial [Streptosporangium sp. NPDC001682]
GTISAGRARVAALIAERFHIRYTPRGVGYPMERLGWPFQSPPGRRYGGKKWGQMVGAVVPRLRQKATRTLSRSAFWAD